MARRIFTTAALPYANGSIHLGHLVEYIMTDIWTRFQKLMGHECVYCCADDAHGTPVMVWSKKEGRPPEELVEQARREHIEDFKAFGIEFDSYHSTHSEENRRLTLEFYRRNVEAGHVDFSEVKMYYCEQDRMFLPDRFVRGVCPKCGAEDQYGDQCEVCNAPYRQADLKDPKCAVCGSAPVVRSTRHAFFKLSDFGERVDAWLDGNINPEIANELRSKWLGPGLRDWDFTRDAPYFGFEVPGEKGLYFYVWWDAPIGYYASLERLCRERGQDLDGHWLSEKTEVFHFIGKDIAYHHGIYWPSMLMGASFPLPKLKIHGFLTINGAKMSKSRGTFINARTYLKHLDPQFLRYYYACKIGPDASDIDMNLEDLTARINADLVGKLANLPSRSATMLGKKLDGRLGAVPDDARALIDRLKGASQEIADHYERVEFGEVARKVCLLADEVNRYIDARKPWVQVNEDPEEARATITATLNATRILAIYLKPVLPGFACKVEELLGEQDLKWVDAQRDLEGVEIGKFKRLLERVDPQRIKAMMEDSRETAAPETRKEETMKTPECSMDDFMKVDLRVARVLEASDVEGADKLIRFKLDIGQGETRTVFAGIKTAYRPEDLTGRLVLAVVNLAPRKMKFGTSEGMVLASGEGGKDIHLLFADEGALPGQRVH